MRLARTALLAAVLLVAVAPAALAADQLRVTVDHTAIRMKLGGKVSLTSTIHNEGSRPAARLVAHLNVLSLRNGVYVDPEDWSSHRTRYLAPIPGGGATTITWRINAVNSGSIGVYVAVLPQSGAPVRPATGPTTRLTIADRRTLNAGGILPLALIIPSLLGVLALALRLRRAD